MKTPEEPTRDSDCQSPWEHSPCPWHSCRGLFHLLPLLDQMPPDQEPQASPQPLGEDTSPSLWTIKLRFFDYQCFLGLP